VLVLESVLTSAYINSSIGFAGAASGKPWSRVSPMLLDVYVFLASNGLFVRSGVRIVKYNVIVTQCFLVCCKMVAW
jgi:hypothetical protein